MDFLLLGAVTASIILIEKNNNFLAGLLFPFLLFKPHILLIFIPFSVFKGGKKYTLAALISTGIVAIIAFYVTPNWPFDMANMLRHSGGRIDNNWGFTTLLSLVGLTENWSGTANLPANFVISAICFILVYRYRNLETISVLLLALTASVFCAPRAYSYNFPLLMPGLLWILPRENDCLNFFLLIGACLIVFTNKYSTESYLLVILVFFLSLLKARKQTLIFTQ